MEGERERQGGSWKGERWREKKKKVKQEIQCEWERRKGREEGRERKRDDLYWLWKTCPEWSYLSDREATQQKGECVNDLPLDTYTCTHTDLAQSWGKNEEEKKLELRCEIKGDLLHLSVINHHVITRVYRSLSLCFLSMSLLPSFLLSFSHFCLPLSHLFHLTFYSRPISLCLDVSISGAEVKRWV